MTETVIPGVGLWTASERRLEGSPERVRLYSLKETVNHLILNVHDPAEIRQTLRNPVFSDIEKLEINYFDVLTIVRTRNLKKLTIGARRGVLGLRETEALQARCPKVEHWS